MTESTPTTDPFAAAMALDMNAELRAITDEQVADLKAAVGAMIDGKVAFKRDGDRDAANAATDDAGMYLRRAGLPGAVLFGDLADGISKARVSALLAAVADRDEAARS